MLYRIISIYSCTFDNLTFINLFDNIESRHRATEHERERWRVYVSTTVYHAGNSVLLPLCRPDKLLEHIQNR